MGRAHGRDGSFYVERPDHPLAEGTVVTVAGHERRVVRRAGTDQRPLIRLSGLEDRAAAAALRGERLLAEGDLDEDEWLARDLVGCRIDGLGSVRRVVDAPSCPLLELDDGTLLPFISDAVRRVDPASRVIEVDLAFLGVER